MARHSWAWMTTDELIHTWLVARCMADRQYIPPAQRDAVHSCVSRGTGGR